jgi:AcrR family transcriptional regulator
MRKQGTRNLAYDERRGALIDRLRKRLGDRDAGLASWRELAAAAEVSLSTLTHYFGRREDVVRAIMEDDFQRGAQPLATMAQPSGPFAQSIADALRHMAEGFRYGGLGAMFATGLIEGLRHPGLGPAFLDNALEPTIVAAEARLFAHMAAGEMRKVDPRGPALALIAPVLLAFLHQAELGGADRRPMELDAFLAEHAGAFVRAWSCARTDA